MKKFFKKYDKKQIEQLKVKDMDPKLLLEAEMFIYKFLFSNNFPVTSKIQTHLLLTTLMKKTESPEFELFGKIAGNMFVKYFQLYMDLDARSQGVLEVSNLSSISEDKQKDIIQRKNSIKNSKLNKTDQEDLLKRVDQVEKEFDVQCCVM